MINNFKSYTRHNYSHTPTYKCWCDMKSRCNNKNNKFYPSYGGRGINVCERWNTNFIDFLEDMGEKPKDLSIDRINVNGNYEPNNCRWATNKEQNMNKRPKNKFLGIRQRGKTYEVTCCHKYIGTFKTLGEAIYNRKLAEKEVLNDKSI